MTRETTRVGKFDPSQARDDQGQWTDGGGGGAGGGYFDGDGEGVYEDPDNPYIGEIYEEVTDTPFTEGRAGDEAGFAMDNGKWVSDSATIAQAKAAFEQAQFGGGEYDAEAKAEVNEIVREYMGVDLDEALADNTGRYRGEKDINGQPSFSSVKQHAAIIERMFQAGLRNPSGKRFRAKRQGTTQAFGSFTKLDDDRRLAFGWAYVTEDDGQVAVDHSGDFIDKAALPDLEDAAYDYVLNSRQADEMHVKLTEVAQLVESVMLTPEKAAAMGITTKRYGYWVGFKVQDEAVWAKIKDGTYGGFSIRGTGEREEAEIEKAKPAPAEKPKGLVAKFIEALVAADKAA